MATTDWRNKRIYLIFDGCQCHESIRLFRLGVQVLTWTSKINLGLRYP
jgi:hypothetical protein